MRSATFSPWVHSPCRSRPRASTSPLLAAAAGTPARRPTEPTSSRPTPTASAHRTRRRPTPAPGQGQLAARLDPAGGADAETSTTIYITYNPSTGQATARKLPGVSTASTDTDAGRPAGQRRPPLGDPRHRHLARRGEERPAQGLLAHRRHHEGRDRHPRSAPARTTSSRSAGPSTPSAPTRCASWTPRTGSGRSTSPAARRPRSGTLAKGAVGVHQRLQPQHRRALGGEHRRATRPSPPATAPPTPAPSPATAAPCSAQRQRRSHRAAAEPVPARRRLHRRPTASTWAFCADSAERDDLLPAQGRQGVDGLRQAEHAPSPRSPPASRWCLPPASQ